MRCRDRRIADTHRLRHVQQARIEDRHFARRQRALHGWNTQMEFQRSGRYQWQRSHDTKERNHEMYFCNPCCISLHGFRVSRPCDDRTRMSACRQCRERRRPQYARRCIIKCAHCGPAVTGCPWHIAFARALHPEIATMGAALVSNHPLQWQCRDRWLCQSTLCARL